ncbi:MAG TPA: YfhO family protein [Thermoanaerobaculia bacterium]|nr:YfhO family protein [Thermoanaerobaculia bacterium]
MNPGLVLVLLASFAGLLWRRSERGVAWAVVGLAAAALLASALVLPDGIPSPSGSMGKVAPWQGAVSEERGIADLVDVSFQFEPWLLYLRSEWRSGRLPFWNPHQYSGAPFWSNGSSAPLFPLHLLFSALPLQLGFVALAWLRVVIGGFGAYRLARELGVSHRAALMAAVVYPLSGRLASFLLVSMSNGLALVPWVFLGVERIARGRGGFGLLAAATGLQLLAGHPETAVFTALASGLYLLVRGCGDETAQLPAELSDRSRRAAARARLLGVWSRFVAAWAVGAAISAVQTVPLAHTLFATDRWQEWTPGEPIPFATALTLWLRFLLPDAFGHGAEETYWGPYSFVATTVYAGALTLPLAVAGAALARRDRRVRGLLVMALVCLLAAFYQAGLREVLLAVPVLQKGLHHYLLLAVELGLALLAAKGFDRWVHGAARGVTVGAALVLVGLAAGWLAFVSEWQERAQLGVQVAWTVLVAGSAILLTAARWLPAARRAWLAPLLVGLAAGDLAVAHARSIPGLPVSQLYPRTPAVAFLAGRPERMAATGFALRPNAAMVYGLYDVRGDDSLKLSHYETVYGAHLGGGHPTYFQPLSGWTSPWLDRLGVRWVMTEPHGVALDPSWRLAYDGPDAVVFERPSAGALVRFEPAAPDASLEVLERRPGRWEIAWDTGEARLLTVAETWDAGWRARLDGRRVPIEVVEGVLLGVRLGPGAGRLVLHHRPAGLAWGTALSLVGLAALGARRRGAAQGAGRCRPGEGNASQH